MAFARIADIVLHYDFNAGDDGGPPIVFLNSLGTDFRIWRQVVDTLGGAFPTLLYDKRGHGLSDLGRPPYTIDDHVNDIAGLLDHLGRQKAVLCGLSVGGLIAQRFQQRYPSRVQGLILCGTAHRVGTEAGWNDRITRVRAEGLAPIAEMVMPLWFTPAFHRERASELAGYRNMVSRQSPEGYAGTCAAIRDADYTAAAAGITVPTLCIAGDQDGSTPPDLVRSLADLIPGARFEVLQQAAHIMCVEQPAAVAALVRDFVTDLRGARK